MSLKDKIEAKKAALKNVSTSKTESRLKAPTRIKSSDKLGNGELPSSQILQKA